MNVLFVASLGAYSTANYLLRALRDCGHHVFAYSDLARDGASEVGGGIVDVEALSRHHDFQPDLVLFVEGGTMKLFPIGLERVSCLTAWYGIDTHMDYAKHLTLSRAFDVTFIAQKQYVARLRADGVHQAHWLPLAFAPELLPQDTPTRDLDVAYVGSMNQALHPERHALLTALQQRFPANFIGPASAREMASIYSRAKVIFNKSVNNDVNMRYFEAMGTGAVLVTDPAQDNGAEELFEEGIHYLTYTDRDSLLRAVESVLRDENWHRRIAEAAREMIFSRHTYRHRALQLIDTVSRSKRQVRPGADIYFGVFSHLRMPEGMLAACLAALAQQGPGRGDWLAAKITSIPVRLAAGVAAALSAARRAWIRFR